MGQFAPLATARPDVRSRASPGVDNLTTRIRASSRRNSRGFSAHSPRENEHRTDGTRVALSVGMNRLMATLAVGLVLSITVMWDVARDAIAATAHPHRHQVQQTVHQAPLPPPAPATVARSL